jgi:hypothetical protein
MLIEGIAIYGQRKRGKSTFAMSCPTPIVYFDFELGASRVEPMYIPTDMKIIDMYEAKLGYTDTKNDAIAMKFWIDFEKQYMKALENPDVKTIVWDTASKVWEAKRHDTIAKIRLTYPDRISLNKFEYTIPNKDMAKLVILARSYHKLLILVHHTKDIYKNDEPTGELTWDGFTHTGDSVDIVMFFDKQDGVPYATITDCGLTLKAEGVTLESPTYADVESLVMKLRSN